MIELRRKFLFVLGALVGLAGCTHSETLDSASLERILFAGTPDTLRINFICRKDVGFRYFVSIKNEPGRTAEVGEIFLLGLFGADNRRTLINGLRTYQVQNDYFNVDPNLPQPRAAAQADQVLSLFQIPNGFEVAVLGSFDEPSSMAEYQKEQIALLKKFESNPQSVRRTKFALATAEQKRTYNAFLNNCVALGFKPVLSKRIQ